MGLSLSSLLSSSENFLKHRLLRWREISKDTFNITFDSKDGEILTKASFKKRYSGNSTKSGGSDGLVIGQSVSQTFKKWEPRSLRLETTVSFKNLALDDQTLGSPKLFNELNVAALRVQKVNKSYRTRRNLADCAVVEELWRKALDFVSLRRCSVSFFNINKPESAVSRWARARTRAAKVGKGLSKNEKAQKLALEHWLEAIDPRHRYGHNLRLYYGVWFNSHSLQPFFYWLDVGDGKEVSLEKCPRTDLQRQCIRYLGPNERAAYEVIVEQGKLVHKQSGMLVDTVEGSKWIFVLCTSRKLYVGEKKKGLFQHSSFLAGGATIASGRLVATDGVLEAIWPYSGHYRPTEENLKDLIDFLERQHVDLSNVKKCAVDDDIPPPECKKDKKSSWEPKRRPQSGDNTSSTPHTEPANQWSQTRPPR